MDTFLKSEHTVQIDLPSNKLDKNYINEIEKILKQKYEHTCHPKIGYIEKGSVQMLKKTQGIIHGSHLTGKISFVVTFSCKSTRPVANSTIICQVTKENVTGLFAITKDGRPYDILISRSLEDNPIINQIKKNSIIEITVIDSKLIPGDKRNKSKYLIIGKIHKSTVPNQKKQQLVINRLTESNFHCAFKTISSISAYEPWKLRSEYINYGSTTYSDLLALREKIDLINQRAKDLNITHKNTHTGQLWDTIKELINDYEFVKRESLLDSKKYSINRAFFKMHEIIIDSKNASELDFDLIKPNNMRILNLAESPGGFIQAIIYNRKYNLHENEKYVDQYVAVSISENESGEKLWQPFKTKIENAQKDKFEEFMHVTCTDVAQDSSLSTSNSIAQGANVHFVNKNNGDLTKIENINYIHNDLNFKTEKADLITADGSFANDEEAITKEINHYKLFFCEMVIALSSQAINGHFIMKVHDTLTQFTVEMIAFLSSFYAKTYIYKPYTSRPANAEKYLVCCNFSGIEPTTIEKLKKAIELWPEEEVVVSLDIVKNIDEYSSFLDQIKAYNASFLNIEYNNIKSGLSYIEDIILEQSASKATIESSVKNLIRDREDTQTLQSRIYLEKTLDLKLKPKA